LSDLSTSERAAPKDWLDADELEALRALLGTGVRFIIVGGRAVQFHGVVRPAKDLDLLVEFTQENWERLRQALRQLNGSIAAFESLSPARRYQAKLNFYPL
jgi:hypothetical protein